VKARDILKRVKRDGWILKETKGDHRQFIHPVKSGRVTVAGHRSDEVHPKTLGSILKQAGLK